MNLMANEDLPDVSYSEKRAIQLSPGGPLSYKNLCVLTNFGPDFFFFKEKNSNSC